MFNVVSFTGFRGEYLDIRGIKKYYYYYYLLAAIGLMPSGSVYKRDIQLTKNIAPPCRGKKTRTSHDISQYNTTKGSTNSTVPNGAVSTAPNIEPRII
jgi:hypothetical protein